MGRHAAGPPGPKFKKGDNVRSFFQLSSDEDRNLPESHKGEVVGELPQVAGSSQKLEGMMRRVMSDVMRGHSKRGAEVPDAVAAGPHFHEAVRVLEKLGLHLPAGTSPANLLERICVAGHAVNSFRERRAAADGEAGGVPNGEGLSLLSSLGATPENDSLRGWVARRAAGMSRPARG
jgi:hypothetical protein